MMVMVAATVVAAISVLVAPWRAPARPLGPARETAPAPAWVVLGGPAWGASVAVAVTLIHPLPGVFVLLWPSTRAWWARRRRSGEEHRAVLRSLPETADLIVLGVGAGMPLRVAVRHAAEWADPPFQGVFVEALRRAEAGETFAIALETAAATLDDVARPLVGLLATAESDGGALLSGLVRVSDDARRRRRQAAAIRARRLPVTMLLPLVFCVLPAFVLLAVAPLILTSLGEFDFGF